MYKLGIGRNRNGPLYRDFISLRWLIQESAKMVQGACKLSEDFAKPYFHKY
jgi:hypothetical protein